MGEAISKIPPSVTLSTTDSVLRQKADSTKKELTIERLIRCRETPPTLITFRCLNSASSLQPCLLDTIPNATTKALDDVANVTGGARHGPCDSAVGVARYRHGDVVIASEGHGGLGA